MKLDKEEIAVRRDPDGDHKPNSASKSWAEVYAALDAGGFPRRLYEGPRAEDGAMLVSHDAAFRQVSGLAGLEDWAGDLEV